MNLILAQDFWKDLSSRMAQDMGNEVVMKLSPLQRTR